MEDDVDEYSWNKNDVVIFLDIGDIGGVGWIWVIDCDFWRDTDGDRVEGTSVDTDCAVTFGGCWCCDNNPTEDIVVTDNNDDGCCCEDDDDGCDDDAEDDDNNDDGCCDDDVNFGNADELSAFTTDGNIVWDDDDDDRGEQGIGIKVELTALVVSCGWRNAVPDDDDNDDDGDDDNDDGDDDNDDGSKDPEGDDDDDDDDDDPDGSDDDDRRGTTYKRNGIIILALLSVHCE